MTLKDILMDLLGDPPTYDGFPVDLSGLDTPITGYRAPDIQQCYRDVAAATRTYII